MNKENQKIYELGYLLVPSIAEENVAKEVETIKSILAKYEAEVITEDFPKLRPLAYAMVKATGSERHKFDKAYFGWVKFEVEGDTAPQIKNELDKNTSVLRFMIVKTVRENTMVSQKVVFKPEEGEEQPKVSEEELDKTIENLVVE